MRAHNLINIVGTIAGPLSVALALTSSVALANPPTDPPARGAAMRRHVPDGLVVDFGLYGGVMAPASNHGFFATQWRPLAPVVSSLGFRLGLYPLRWLGVEVETGTFPGRTKAGSYFNALTLRGHVLLQLPYRVTPMLLGGAGLLAVRTPNDVLGKDLDAAVYVGAGLKFYVRKWMALRLEWRGMYASGRLGPDAYAMHNEVLFGLSFVFGAKARPPPAPPVDTDGDGFVDAVDRCVRERGVTPDGCPGPDRDYDGFRNDVDGCPDSPGPGPDGCPAADVDRLGAFAAADPSPESCDPDGVIVDNDPTLPRTYTGTLGCAST